MALKLFPKSSKGGISIFIILAVVFIGALAMTGGLLPSKRKPPNPNTEAVSIKQNTDNLSEKSLQLKSLGSVTPTPTPTPKLTPTPGPPVVYCPHDNGLPADATCTCGAGIGEVKIYCENGICRDLLPRTNNCNPDPGLPYTQECRAHGTNFTGYLCIAKPVIYLYPTKKTLVDVSVETSGEIVVSDPLYPNGGWKNVLAYPDGSLIYENKNYRELFYETSVKDVKKPDDGIIVQTKDIEVTLKDLNNKLGLTEFESKELTDFWTPRLKNLGSNYVFISLIGQKEKNNIDRLNIKPSPDTLIEILYYFKPLDKPINIKPLNLPPTPKRTGFTAVEWGGTIEH